MVQLRSAWAPIAAQFILNYPGCNVSVDFQTYRPSFSKFVLIKTLFNGNKLHLNAWELIHVYCHVLKNSCFYSSVPFFVTRLVFVIALIAFFNKNPRLMYEIQNYDHSAACPWAMFCILNCNFVELTFSKIACVIFTFPFH